MSVSDGQSANASIFNAAFVSKTANSTTIGQVTLNNSDSSSGSQVTNIQRELNAVSAWTGKALNVAKDTTPTWSGNDIGASTDSLFDRVDEVAGLFNATTGHGHTGVAGDGPLISLSSAVTGTLPVANLSLSTSRWETYSFAASAFSTASGVADVALLTLPAKGIIESVIVKHSTAFTGASISAYTVSVGYSSEPDRYVSQFDVNQTAAASAWIGESFTTDVLSFSGTTAINIRAEATGDDLDGASAGLLEVWVKRSTLP